MEKMVGRLAILTIIIIFTLNISVSANPDIPSSMGIHHVYKVTQSNNENDEMIIAAYELGVSGKEYKLLPEYAGAERIYKASYEKGHKDYELNRKNQVKIANAGAGLLFFAWLCRRIYVARKMIK